MNRTIEDIQKDIELLGIKGGYDIEQLLTPQDCRRLSYEIERLNNIIEEVREYITYWHYRNDFRTNSFTTGVKEELLEILDKGSDKE